MENVILIFRIPCNIFCHFILFVDLIEFIVLRG